MSFASYHIPGIAPFVWIVLWWRCMSQRERWQVPGMKLSICSRDGLCQPFKSATASDQWAAKMTKGCFHFPLNTNRSDKERQKIRIWFVSVCVCVWMDVCHAEIRARWKTVSLTVKSDRYRVSLTHTLENWRQLPADLKQPHNAVVGIQRVCLNGFTTGLETKATPSIPRCPRHPRDYRFSMQTCLPFQISHIARAHSFIRLAALTCTRPRPPTESTPSCRWKGLISILQGLDLLDQPRRRR